MKILLQILFLSITLIRVNAQEYNVYTIKDNLVINIPEFLMKIDFIELTHKYKDQPFKPNVEFIDIEKSISLQISYGINPLTPELVEELRVSYENRFKEIYPSAVWLETKTKQINSLTVGYLETIDKENYNLIFFTSLENEQVHFAIQGQKENIKVIQKIARNMMESIRIKK